ncbi:pregnancy zone protein [Pimephales promelas]|nr:pregnancy zone protein [Pimephales promelas]
MGIKVATNLDVQAPPCPEYPRFPEEMRFHGLPVDMEMAAMPAAEVAPAEMAPLKAESGGIDTNSFEVTIRTYFPETWLWELAEVGDTGSTQLPLTVPDTITTWETEAFCLSSKGFGLAPPALLTVFQPFFLELSLPYSIIRGESFELKATVFSYLSKCIMVKVTPASSTAFTLKPYTDPYSSCLCANGRKTFKWVLSASVLGAVNVTVNASAEPSQTRCGTEIVTVPTRGRIDVVTRSLLVLPEGVERTNTQSFLLCPKGNILSEDVTLMFPTNVIETEHLTNPSVLGDIMGRALKNLDRLLQMPYGCGEQNMIILAPNIYILLYLEVTGQLTAPIRETATGFLKSGYQRQLNYRHNDGSYSTFGNDESNTWLTAFVMRSFGLARQFIFIDPHVLQSAKDWLIRKQGSDGCFIQQGTLYHSEMKGGVGDGVTMTAYIVASLLELGVPTMDPVITNGLSCLRPVVGNLVNTYVTALLAYTFSLAGETTTRSQLLTSLDNLAISNGTNLHWSQTTSGDTLAVEISSYVLLAVLAVQPLTTANLGYANRIVNWLVTQQNPYGGFSSTQDTVVALHALSVYAAQVFSLDGSSSVTVQSSEVGGDSYSFKVNRDNRLLYQEKRLKNVPGKYTVKVSGSTCVSVQVACFYNIPTPVKSAKTLSVKANVNGDCQQLGANLMLNFTVKYDGVKASTNMVVVDIKLLSGFTADKSLLELFDPIIERVDLEDDHVLVYLKEVPKGVPMSYTLQLNQVLKVNNLKPAVIHVYDYYQTSLFMVTFPALIESGSEAKLCITLLKPQENLTITVSLMDEKNKTTQLVQRASSTSFHRCFSFQAPRVDGDLVQKLKVDVQGKVFRASEERKVMFRRYLPLTFIQTDKPIYNPGQTVNFRVVTMDTRFVPFDQMYNLVVVEDNNNNRIGQWTNISSAGWILQLSHELNPEARMGVYTLKAFIGERTISHVFEVKKYVLPKFDVTVNTPQTYSVGDEGLKVEACAKYTYGQPVLGQALVEVCREPYRYVGVPDLTRRCLNKTAKMNDTGCASLAIDASVFFNTKFEPNMQDTFLVNVNVTEVGTDVVMSKSATVSITFEVGKVMLVDLPDYFEAGSMINGKASKCIFLVAEAFTFLNLDHSQQISVSRFNGTPIANKVVYLLDGNSWPNKLLQNLTTNQKGLATFSLNTANLPEAALNLVASVTPEVVYSYKSPYFTTDSRVIQLLQSASPDTPSFSELKIVKLQQPLKCGAVVPVTVKYSFVGEAGGYSTDIVYMVMSRGVNVLHGFQTVTATASTVMSGSVSFQLSVSVDMAPVVQILVYCVLPSENVVVGSASFDTETCFQNQASLRFSPAKAVPAEENVLTVSAQAGSLCGISAVDQSIRIMEPGRRLSAEMVFNLLPIRSLSEYPYEVEDEQECLNVRPRRAIPTDQAYETFKSMGMKVATNLPIRFPQCVLYRGLNYYRNFHYVEHYRQPVDMAIIGMAPEVASVGGDTSSSDVTVRTYFPETWIWHLAQVGATGSTRVPLTVPDTITTWETEAFCLSSKGFGLAPPALLTVFQPFFLELSLPYSIIRGESFDLKATIFSYQSNCIMVKVTPASSMNFTLKPYSDPYSSCICANGRKTFKWALSVSVLGAVNVTVNASAEPSQTRCGTEVVTVPTRGRIDVVTQSLLVLPEGVERTNTQSWLLCPKGKVLSEDVTLTFPTNVVQGSARCSVSVLGDIMGRALKNLDGLLQMPSGCGEQNMIILAPNIYILLYLEVTGQLTTAIRATAIGYLQNGYQGQLNYRHSDGSYSTFGYDASNTWLTAFVMRSFGLAKRFIFIDPNVLQSAKDWLISQQGSNGCLVQQGTLYHNDMKGGVGDNVTMTAYVVASLLELGVPATDPVITNALACLRPVVGNLGNTYTTALLTYTFSLAGETTTRSQLLTTLNNLAISEGTKLHWSQTTSGDTLAVEISSYVLLAVLAVQPLTTADLGYANRIVNWLVTQQNPYGGFSSTQDTVVALQALSVYAAQVFSLDGTSTVTIQSSVVGGDSYSFNVNRDNRLLYQEKQLKNVPGKYSVKASGSTCLSVQVACFYNIPTPVKDSKTLTVEAKVTGDCRPLGANLMLNFTVKYNGVKASTNMVLVDIKLLSGFTADTSPLGSPPQSFAPLVERVDAEDDRVLVYLKEVPKGVPMSYTLQLKQVFAVKNIKPAVINVYDYYQTSDSFETTYTSPCQ